MTSCLLLSRVSALQLSTGVFGMALALRRRHPHDLPLLGMRGNPDAMLRDSLLKGTALSAPGTMIAAQGICTVLLAATEGRRAAQMLGVLGAAMVAGSLGERLVWKRLRMRDWDLLETPLVVLATTLSAAMPVIAAGCVRRRRGAES